VVPIIFYWRMWLFLFCVDLTPQSLFLETWNFTSYLGSIIHGLSHKEHKQAHSKAEDIEKIVTIGIYSKIRHPGYLGLILMYLGVALLFHNILADVWMGYYNPAYVEYKAFNFYAGLVSFDDRGSQKVYLDNFYYAKRTESEEWLSLKEDGFEYEKTFDFPENCGQCLNLVKM